MKKLLCISLLLFLHSCASCYTDDFKKIIDFRIAYASPCSDCTAFTIDGKKLYLAGYSVLDSSHIAKAWKNKNAFGTYDIYLDLTSKGAVILQKTTRKHRGRHMIVLVNGDPVMAPRIIEEIKGGKVTITGIKTEAEVDNIVRQLQTR